MKEFLIFTAIVIGLLIVLPTLPFVVCGILTVALLFVLYLSIAGNIRIDIHDRD